eukprot:PhM_4_TR16347/c0_g1_i1/m.56393
MSITPPANTTSPRNNNKNNNTGRSKRLFAASVTAATDKTSGSTVNLKLHSALTAAARAVTEYQASAQAVNELLTFTVPQYAFSFEKDAIASAQARTVQRLKAFQRTDIQTQEEKHRTLIECECWSAMSDIEGGVRYARDADRRLHDEKVAQAKKEQDDVVSEETSRRYEIACRQEHEYSSLCRELISGIEQIEDNLQQRRLAEEMAAALKARAERDAEELALREREDAQRRAAEEAEYQRQIAQQQHELALAALAQQREEEQMVRRMIQEQVEIEQQVQEEITRREKVKTLDELTRRLEVIQLQRQKAENDAKEAERHTREEDQRRARLGVVQQELDRLRTMHRLRELEERERRVVEEAVAGRRKAEERAAAETELQQLQRVQQTREAERLHEEKMNALRAQLKDVEAKHEHQRLEAEKRRRDEERAAKERAEFDEMVNEQRRIELQLREQQANKMIEQREREEHLAREKQRQSEAKRAREARFDHALRLSYRTPVHREVVLSFFDGRNDWEQRHPGSCALSSRGCRRRKPF